MINNHPGMLLGHKCVTFITTCFTLSIKIVILQLLSFLQSKNAQRLMKKYFSMYIKIINLAHLNICPFNILLPSICNKHYWQCVFGELFSFRVKYLDTNMQQPIFELQIIIWFIIWYVTKCRTAPVLDWNSPKCAYIGHAEKHIVHWYEKLDILSLNNFRSEKKIGRKLFDYCQL